jgi:predicted anti-sigma-YlaC factor YlaD
LGPEDVQCTAFRAAISEWLDGFCSDEQKLSFDQHLTSCSGCRREAEVARAALELVHDSEPPELPSRFAERVMARVADDARDPDSLHCETFSLLLDPLLADELGRGRRDAMRAHVARCERCGEQLRNAEGFSRWLQLWTVPEPRPGLTGRIMARIAGARALSRRQNRLRLAAAALLAAAAIWLIVLNAPNFGSRPSANPIPPSPPRPVAAGLDLTPRGPLWPVGVGGQAGDPLDLQSRPFGESFRRDLQPVSDRPRR